VLSRRIGKWLATGLIAATAVNALAQPLADCQMRAADAAAGQTTRLEQTRAEQASARQDDRTCRDHGAEAAVASEHEAAPGERTEHCADAGSCTRCATGVCSGSHPALNIGSIFRAGYDPAPARHRAIPQTDAPRSVFHNPPWRPPRT